MMPQVLWANRMTEKGPTGGNTISTGIRFRGSGTVEFMIPIH